MFHQSGVNHRILVLARVCWATFTCRARFLLVLNSLAGGCGQVAAESPLRIWASWHIDACSSLTPLNLLIALKNITEIALLADIFSFTHGALYRRESSISSFLLYLRVASLGGCATYIGHIYIVNIFLVLRLLGLDRLQLGKAWNWRFHVALVCICRVDYRTVVRNVPWDAGKRRLSLIRVLNLRLLIFKIASAHILLLYHLDLLPMVLFDHPYVLGVRAIDACWLVLLLDDALNATQRRSCLF